MRLTFHAGLLLAALVAESTVQAKTLQYSALTQISAQTDVDVNSM